MALKPLNMESIVANSIARFVLDHPEYGDTVDAYNAWAGDVAIASSYPMDHQMTMFAIEQFDCCIHRQPKERLKALLDMEREFNAVKLH